MNTTEARAVLVRAFSALTAGQKARLRKHAEKGTSICCGMERAALYYDYGAG